jgi:protein PhnA
MSNPPPCPRCSSAYFYEDRNMFVCPECGHEWEKASKVDENDGTVFVKDANGTQLADGDTVSAIKDLKLKGSSSVIKSGCKVKNIRLVEGDHNIDCKIGGIGAIKLKSEFVKKV